MNKILFLTTQNILGEIQNGGMQCAQRNWSLLQRYAGKDNLYAGIIWNEGGKNIDPQYIKYYRRIRNNFEALFSSIFMTKTYFPFEYKKIRKDIDRIKPDYLFLDSSLLGKILKGLNPNIEKIVFFHNIESEYAWHKVKKQGIYFLPSYIVSQYNEKKVIQCADRIICLNARDNHILEKKYGRLADLILPISFNDRFDEKRVVCQAEKNLLFVGSLFPPNYDGIKWFVEEVMSELKDFKLLIVGKDFEQKRGELERNNVEVIGTVKNPDLYYYQNAVVVMPILYGDGMKVKTAEAMMFGKTIFATTEALEGYDIDKILSGIYCCNQKEEFISGIRRAFKENKIRAVNYDVRNYFLENHTIDSQFYKLKAFMDGMEL